MNEDFLKNSLRDLLEKHCEEAEFCLSQARKQLELYRDAGGAQQSAIQLLESLRYVRDADWEDRVLEVLDIAYGFCRAELRVW
jgi:hypothetical protein